MGHKMLVVILMAVATLMSVAWMWFLQRNRQRVGGKARSARANKRGQAALSAADELFEEPLVRMDTPQEAAAKADQLAARMP